jgi:peroxiredoxin Q/BCP
MAELKEGRKAPAFTLPSGDGDKISLKQYRDQHHVVLYFYPRDMTSGCTKEAESFRDLRDQFAEAEAVILGVSTDDPARHARFTEKSSLNFPLLSDVEAKVADKYGVWQEKKMAGRTYMGIVRTTFVIDKSGTIRRIWPKVKVAGHAEEVLEFVRELQS